MDVTKEIYLSPYSCYINLTSKCNLRCKHCFGNYSVEHENELTLEQWKKVIDDLVDSKVFYVNISGGEATQSPFFKEFILYLEKKGLHFILTTNGVFSKNVRDFIVNNSEYLIGIKISLDGPDAESHGFIRLDAKEEYNPKIFDITLKNIMYFSKKKIPLTIATVLHKKNIKKIKEFQELIKKINPISWFVSPIIPIGRGDVNRLISEFYEYFDNDFWKGISDKGKQNKINVNLIDVPIHDKKEGVLAYSCAGSITFCEIHSNGIVSPCTLSRVCIPKKYIDFENIKYKTLLEIWNGDVFNKFRSYMDRGCDGCKMLSKCNKCVAQSFRYFGNGKSPTPFCIKQGTKLGLKDLKCYQTVLKDKFGMDLK